MGFVSTSAFAWGTPDYRGIVVRSFGNNNTNAAISASFQVPSDYVGPTAQDLADCPTLTTPRLKIRWVTDAANTNPGARKVNMDVSFSQDESLNYGGGVANKHRYNFRQNGNSGLDSGYACESLDPTNNQVASQVIPEPGDVWNSMEGGALPWVPGQTILLTLYRNATSADDTNTQRVGIFQVSFDYEADM